MIGVLLLLAALASPPADETACDSLADGTRIAAIGAFSNMRYTDEHAYGYTVMLWRAGRCLVGFLESSDGLAGDTPIGELEDVGYNEKTGKLSFSARLTMGVVSFKGSSGFEQSRDLFTFDGFLRRTTMTGVVTHVLRNDPNSTPTRTTVTLRLSRGYADVMQRATTYREWRDKWAPVLRFRGPKW